MSEAEKYIFEAEWYDKTASTLRKFYLHYYPSDNSVQLFDIKTRKTYLKRSKCEGIAAKDFYVGAVVTLFSRSIQITDFANETTKERLQSEIVKKFIILKPNAIEKLDDILITISEHNFHISNIKMAKINYEDALQVFKSLVDQSPTVIECMTSGPVIALELLSKSNTQRWPELSLELDKDALLSEKHIPNDNEIAKRFLSLEKSRFKNTAKFQHCTCCIIKPHAVQSGLTASIINDIMKENFIISAIQQFYVSPVNAEEFLEVYKGILPDYAGMVSELQSGPCIAMEITHKDNNFDVVTEFRKLCGPLDPEMAKELRPTTLRAKYGKTRIQNAVHCSDLQEDGLLEVEYFFKILDDQ